MKLGQLNEYDKRSIFLQKSCWQWCRETSSIPIFVFVFPKTLYYAIASGLQFTFNRPQLIQTVWNFKNWSRDMLNFDFLEKWLRIVSPSHFVYDFSRTLFPILYSISWPNCIVWLPLLLEILGNHRIAIVYFPGCDVFNSEIILVFLIKPFFYTNKKSRQIFKYLKNEKNF